MEKSLYQLLLDGGVSAKNMANHESDLYVPVTPVSTAIIKAYFAAWDEEHNVGEPNPQGVWRVPNYKTPMPAIFRSQTDGAMMYDIPFMYEPWWASRCGTPDGTQRAGGYVFLSTYANLTDEEYAVTKEWDEYPVAYIGVEKDFFMKSVAGRYKNEREFFAEYTYDEVSELEGAAMLAGMLAFSYRPDLDVKFDLPEYSRSEAMLALVDFLSGKLRESGHIKASEYFSELTLEHFLGWDGRPTLEQISLLSQALQDGGDTDASKYIDALFDL